MSSSRAAALCTLSTEWHTSFSWKNELLWVNISFLLPLLCLSSVHCPHLQTKMFCLRYAKYNNLWFSDSTYVQKMKMIARWRQDPAPDRNVDTASPVSPSRRHTATNNSMQISPWWWRRRGEGWLTGAGGGMRLVIKQLGCTVQGWSHPPHHRASSRALFSSSHLLDGSYFGRDIYILQSSRAGVFSRFPITFLVTRLVAHLTSYKLSYIYLTTFWLNLPQHGQQGSW